MITAALVDQIRNQSVPVLLLSLLGSRFVSSLVALLLSAAYCSSFRRADANGHLKVSTGSELCPRAEQCKANLGLMSGGQRRADTSISKVTPRSVRRLAVGLLGILKIIQSRNCDQASCTQYAPYLLDGTKVEGGVEASTTANRPNHEAGC